MGESRRRLGDGTGIHVPKELWNQLPPPQTNAHSYQLALKLNNGRLVDRVVVDLDGELRFRLVNTRAEFTMEGLDFSSEDIVAIKCTERRRFLFWSRPVERWIERES